MYRSNGSDSLCSAKSRLKQASSAAVGLNERATNEPNHWSKQRSFSFTARRRYSICAAPKLSNAMRSDSRRKTHPLRSLNPSERAKTRQFRRVREEVPLAVGRRTGVLVVLVVGYSPANRRIMPGRMLDGLRMDAGYCWTDPDGDRRIPRCSARTCTPLIDADRVSLDRTCAHPCLLLRVAARSSSDYPAQRATSVYALAAEPPGSPPPATFPTAKLAAHRPTSFLAFVQHFAADPAITSTNRDTALQCNVQRPIHRISRPSF